MFKHILLTRTASDSIKDGLLKTLFCVNLPDILYIQDEVFYIGTSVQTTLIKL